MILFEKEDFKFIYINKNHYKIQFIVKNNNIILPKIIDFTLIKLIYDLNPDIYEKVNMEEYGSDKDSVIITILMKHLFEDIGLSQKFSFIHMNKTVEEKKITFQSKSIVDLRPNCIPEDAELLNIQNMTCICDIITTHHVIFSINIIFDTETNIPPFAEKMIGLILYKIITRVKQFIENIIL
jgi:hypothetical protein